MLYASFKFLSLGVILISLSIMLTEWQFKSKEQDCKSGMALSFHRKRVILFAISKHIIHTMMGSIFLLYNSESRYAL